MSRILIVLIALDHMVFALLTLGNCKRGETMSAAAWSLELHGKRMGKVFRPGIDWLFTWVERDHCELSWMAERACFQGNE
jgi:hypothetical protein